MNIKNLLMIIMITTSFQKAQAMEGAGLTSVPKTPHRNVFSRLATVSSPAELANQDSGMIITALACHENRKQDAQNKTLFHDPQKEKWEEANNLYGLRDKIGVKTSNFSLMIAAGLEEAQRFIPTISLPQQCESVPSTMDGASAQILLGKFGIGRPNPNPQTAAQDRKLAIELLKNLGQRLEKEDDLVGYFKRHTPPQETQANREHQLAVFLYTQLGGLASHRRYKGKHYLDAAEYARQLGLRLSDPQLVNYIHKIVKENFPHQFHLGDLLAKKSKELAKREATLMREEVNPKAVYDMHADKIRELLATSPADLPYPSETNKIETAPREITDKIFSDAPLEGLISLQLANKNLSAMVERYIKEYVVVLLPQARFLKIKKILQVRELNFITCFSLQERALLRKWFPEDSHEIVSVLPLMPLSHPSRMLIKIMNPSAKEILISTPRGYEILSNEYKTLKYIPYIRDPIFINLQTNNNVVEDPNKIFGLKWKNGKMESLC